MAKKDEPPKQTWSSGRIGKAWNISKGIFSTETKVTPGKKDSKKTEPDLTETISRQGGVGGDFTSDLGLSDAKNIGGFQLSHHFGGSLSGGPGGGEGAPGLDIGLVRARFKGVAAQSSRAIGDKTLFRSLTVTGRSQMQAEDINGHGQVAMSSMGTSITVIAGRQFGGEEEG